MRTVVVLPAPLGPSTPYTAPVGTVRLTPSTARCCPKVLTSPTASMAGSEVVEVHDLTVPTPACSVLAPCLHAPHTEEAGAQAYDRCTSPGPGSTGKWGLLQQATEQTAQVQVAEAAGQVAEIEVAEAAERVADRHERRVAESAGCVGSPAETRSRR